MSKSQLEAEFWGVLEIMSKAEGWPYPLPERELHFDWCCEHPKAEHSIPLVGGGSGCVPCAPVLCEYRRGRAFRFDFAWPDVKLAVECDGGTRTGGRHVRPLGFESDMQKMNLATLKGWRVLRFTRRHITSGEALQQVEWALKAASPVEH